MSDISDPPITSAPDQASNAPDQANSAASQDRTVLQAVINAVPAPIFYKGSDGRYLGCNQAFEEYIGLTRSELVGKTVFELFDPELAQVYHDADASLLEAEGKQIYEAQVKYADGSIRDVVFHKATFDAVDEAITGLVGVILDITERKKSEARYRQLALTDTVTQIDNRFAFLHSAETALDLAGRSGQPLVLMMIDLDNFKHINDSLGHQKGDKVLFEVARRLTQATRKTDKVARLGGDEFAILIQDTLNSPDDVTRLAEKILDANQPPIDLDDTQVQVNISIGIAFAPEHGSDIDTLIHHADCALYQTKNSGKNGFTIWV
ncbi:diguanylate cyclase domain-containing protein [Pseudomaricurvus sp.]|uniref:diguanylate cyclase domain-containing protein n=1 Tax=Pseudomaricurvus sp. TaxID=2004510 RepID=UPI003F6BF4E7